MVEGFYEFPAPEGLVRLTKHRTAQTLAHVPLGPGVLEYYCNASYVNGMFDLILALHENRHGMATEIIEMAVRTMKAKLDMQEAADESERIYCGRQDDE